MEEKEKKETQQKKNNKTVFGMIILLSLLLTLNLILALPDKPAITSVSNQTFANPYTGFFNISGGYIATINLTANFQNTNWKAFIGNVTGKFTLSDAGGSTIFDWTFATTTGNVYATRSSGAITWGSINCSNVTYLENENVQLGFNSSLDNITATFDNVTHSAFLAAGRYMSANSCPTLNTYKNNATQDADFEEMAMYDGSNTLYATILENDVVGYDGNPYDFQMIVPENASSAWGGAIAYYMYVELV